MARHKCSVALVLLVLSHSAISQGNKFKSDFIYIYFLVKCAEYYKNPIGLVKYSAVLEWSVTNYFLSVLNYIISVVFDRNDWKQL